MNPHTKLIDDTMVALSGYRYTRVLKLTTGVFLTQYGTNVRVGVPGTFDLVVLRRHEYIFLDAKTGNAVLSKEQRAFQAMILDLGGRAAAFHSVEEAIKIVNPV